MRTLEFCQSLLDLSEHFETMVKRKREEQDLGNSEGPATKHANTLQGTRQPVYLPLFTHIKNVVFLGRNIKFNEL